MHRVSSLVLWVTCLGLLPGCGTDADTTGAARVAPPVDATVPLDVGTGDSRVNDANPGDMDGGPPPPVDAQTNADSEPIPDSTPMPDAAPEVDAQPPEPDSGTPMGTDCAAWQAMDGDDLLGAMHVALHEAYRPVTPEVERCGDACRYVAARRLMFTQVERFADDEGSFIVEGVYTGTQTPQPADMDPDRAAINCEHTWPRSRMSPEDIDDIPTAMYSHQQADIHNLLPATPLANSTRGNSPFGEVTNAVNTLAPGVVLGDDADGNRVFQPRIERQGDVARIIFYFSVRWGGDIPDFEEEVLRRWSAEDPPDAYEARRNGAIEMLQGNRNPFIDCPDLVDRVPNFIRFEIRDTEEGLGFP